MLPCGELDEEDGCVDEQRMTWAAAVSGCGRRGGWVADHV